MNERARGVAKDVWNPAQYERFRAEREQPFFDLLALVQPGPGMRVVDLGCGTGRGTVLLHERVHAAATLGIDRSARMLEAGPGPDAPPGVSFAVGAIQAFSATAAYDLVFSNAAFHWVDNHRALIPRLVAALTPGGQLAFQVPAMHDAPTHTVAAALAAREPYRSALGGWRKPEPVLQPDAYARLLFEAGLRPPRAMLIVYPHVLAGPEDVVEWTRGTLLTEYEQRMDADVFDGFVEEYRQRLLAVLPSSKPFLFAYKRILCWGRQVERAEGS